jgi:hypothetical protein
MTTLTGTWTYRSFINNPAAVNGTPQAAALIFGEGQLDIERASAADGFRATLSFGPDAIMDLSGSVADAAGSAPLVIAAKGRGRPGGPIADFAYDYLFYAVPDWPEGVDQRPALVGSVIRAADHGEAKKGFTASTITIRRDA